MRKLQTTRITTAPEPLGADVECGGLPPPSVAEARLGDFGGATSVGNSVLARFCVTVHDSRRAPENGFLLDTPYRVEFLPTHSKQRTALHSTRHGNAPPFGRLIWLALRTFRIISAPISHKETRVQGR